MSKATARLSAGSKAIDATASYGVSYAVPLWLRDEQIKIACRKVSGRIQPYKGEPKTEPIAIVGFGPSLRETWEAIRAFKYIISCSGAHKFLLERGIVPTWHLEVDPREHKIELIGKPHPQVTYLPCSTVHPKYIAWLLEHDSKIELWHSFANDDEALRVLPQGEYALTGGCDAGMRAMAVARFFGFTDQHVFGMDGCAGPDEKSHADEHPKWKAKQWFDMEWPKGSGRIYRTTPALMETARTFPREVDHLKIKVTMYGEGFTQALMREHKPKRTAGVLSFVKPETISKEYRELQAKFHEDRADYGAGGDRHAPTILKLCENLKTHSVLDYGCGKGMLARAMPFPVWEYDPAIPGKQESPRPADLVFCGDVLEHIEPQCLKEVLKDLRRLTVKVGYFVVSTRQAKKTLPDGRNAHLIVKDSAWWRQEIGKYFEIAKVIEAEGNEVHFVVGPKKVAANPEAIAEVQKDGTKARFYCPNETTAWRANTLFTKEPCTIEWIDSFREGETLFDVGANVGGYTIWASARRKVKVYAFEPEAQNYALLCRNMALNDVDGTAYCLALTDAQKIGEIFTSGQPVGGSCNTFDEDVGPDLEPRDGVPQGCIGMRLDDLRLPQPDHIKIDVDGMEHHVLAGGERVLGKVKSILLEVNTNLEEHRAMVARLQALGFVYDEAQVKAALRKDGPFEGCGEYVLRRPSAEALVLAKIAAAEMREAPFPHLYIEDVFPAELYAELAKSLPESGYKPLAEARGTKGYPQRFVHEAPQCVSWMTDGRLRKLLDERFGVKSEKDETLLLRDFPGYSIAPHTDSPTKAVSALFYVPRTWTEAEHGTSVYVPLKKGYSDRTGVHNSARKFKQVWQAPGKPNSVFIFARTDRSFHGAEPYKGMATRDLLLWDSKKGME